MQWFLTFYVLYFPSTSAEVLERAPYPPREPWDIEQGPQGQELTILSQRTAVATMREIPRKIYCRVGGHWC